MGLQRSYLHEKANDFVKNHSGRKKTSGFWANSVKMVDNLFEGLPATASFSTMGPIKPGGFYVEIY
jgi:hypothetical protein